VLIFLTVFQITISVFAGVENRFGVHVVVEEEHRVVADFTEVVDYREGCVSVVLICFFILRLAKFKKILNISKISFIYI
jgi:hypothetical protein